MKNNEIPDWLDKKLWAEFVKHRNRLRKPMTKFAEELLISKLLKCKLEGYDPNILITESIEMGWQTVYPKPHHKQIQTSHDVPPPQYRGSVLNPDYQEWLANKEFEELNGTNNTSPSEEARHEALRSVQRANFEHKVADLAGEIENSKPRRLN